MRCSRLLVRHLRMRMSFSGVFEAGSMITSAVVLSRHPVALGCLIVMLGGLVVCVFGHTLRLGLKCAPRPRVTAAGALVLVRDLVARRLL